MPNRMRRTFARGERREDLGVLVGEVDADHALARRDDRPVLDEVAEVAVLLVADRGLEGDQYVQPARSAAARAKSLVI